MQTNTSIWLDDMMHNIREIPYIIGLTIFFVIVKALLFFEPDNGEDSIWK